MYVPDPNNTVVPAFQQVIIGPFGGPSGWTPPGNGGHKCLLAAIFAGDEAAPAFPLAPAYSSNQIAQRNLEFSGGSNCTYNITNSTSSTASLLIGVSVTPALPAPGSSGGPVVTLTFADPTSAWADVWNGQNGITVAPSSPSSGQTTVTLNTSEVALNTVPLLAAQAPTVTISITPAAGSGLAPSVALSSLLTDSSGNIIQENGGTCQYTAPSACASGLTLCGIVCVNEVTDPGNCGSCGNACVGGASCSSGNCSSSPQ